jgi:hypothetical protein
MCGVHLKRDKYRVKLILYQGENGTPPLVERGSTRGRRSESGQKKNGLNKAAEQAHKRRWHEVSGNEL